MTLKKLSYLMPSTLGSSFENTDFEASANYSVTNFRAERIKLNSSLRSDDTI